MNTATSIAIIAALGNKNELGKDNTLLWDMPLDMKHFRDTTRNHAIIMGRKTFESIGKPLPGRQNIVITRDTNYTAKNTTIAYSLIDALEKVDTEKYPNEVFVIGGAQIYAEALTYAKTLYITHIHADFPTADTFFPNIDTNIFTEFSREVHTKDEQHGYDYDFVIYKKINSNL
jgi:dihydrofolate reductase